MSYLFNSVDPTTLPLSPTPDAHWRIEEQGQVLAQCSLWWSQTSPISGHQVGAIGHLRSVQAEAATSLVDRACDQLRRQGCTLAIGPMDGNTWHAYRCITHWGDEPPFLGEPPTTPEWATYFAAAGFRPVAQYESRLCTNLLQSPVARSPRYPTAAIAIRSAINLDPETLLTQIHPLIMGCFQRQPLFQPLSLAQFSQHYRPLLPLLQPELVFLAYDQDALVGLLLAMPDQGSQHSQTPSKAASEVPSDPESAPRRLILKTLAVQPSRRYAGLGYPLIEAAHQAGYALGYRQAIHALMHTHNVSRNLSRRYAQPMRQYVLMGKTLS